MKASRGAPAEKESRRAPDPGAVPSGGDDPWAERSDEQVRRQIDAALSRAKAQDKQVLLEFIAPWCHDCREVVRVAKEPPARDVIEKRYERVFVNVGSFDRHDELRERHGVGSIATLVVLDAEGERVARTNLEPITRRQELTPEALAAWLESPSDDTSPLPAE